MNFPDRHLNAIDPDDCAFEVDARKRRERWMSTYSDAALEQGAVVDRSVVSHKRFLELVQVLDRMFVLSKQFRQPYGGIIAGDAGMGKTTLCEYFLQTLPSHELSGDHAGVLTLRLIRGRALSSVIQQVLANLGYPLSKVNYQNETAKRALSFDALRRHKIRLLLVDEAHVAFLRSGSS